MLNPLYARLAARRRYQTAEGDETPKALTEVYGGRRWQIKSAAIGRPRGFMPYARHGFANASIANSYQSERRLSSF
jgi:hypothetical protein